MKRILILFILVIISAYQAHAQKSSFLVLGDIHYDLLQDHDMGWLGTKPGDLRQVTEEYTKYTRENWSDFTAVLKKRIVSGESPVKAFQEFYIPMFQKQTGNPEIKSATTLIVTRMFR